MTIKFDKKLIFPAIIVGIGLFLSLLTYFLCQPLLKAIADTTRQEDYYTREISSANDLLGTKNVRGLYRQLVPQDKVSFAMDAIKRQAAKNGVTLTLLRPAFAAAQDSALFSRVLFEMQASASLKGLGDFLAAVRNMPEGLVDIDSFNLVPDKETPRLGLAKITFVLFVARNND